MCLDNLKIVREAIIMSLIQYFEADFLWKVSLKILTENFHPKISIFITIQLLTLCIIIGYDCLKAKCVDPDEMLHFMGYQYTKD